MTDTSNMTPEQIKQQLIVEGLPSVLMATLPMFIKAIRDELEEQADQAIAEVQQEKIKNQAKALVDVETEKAAQAIHKALQEFSQATGLTAQAYALWSMAQEPFTGPELNSVRLDVVTPTHHYPATQ